MTPEINFSRITVGGDMGGLLVAVGSVVILMIGLPGMRAYLAAALVSGVLFAGARIAWRALR